MITKRGYRSETALGHSPEEICRNKCLLHGWLDGLDRDCSSYRTVRVRHVYVKAGADFFLSGESSGLVYEAVSA